MEQGSLGILIFGLVVLFGIVLSFSGAFHSVNKEVEHIIKNGKVVEAEILRYGLDSEGSFCVWFRFVPSGQNLEMFCSKSAPSGAQEPPVGSKVKLYHLASYPTRCVLEPLGKKQMPEAISSSIDSFQGY